MLDLNTIDRLIRKKTIFRFYYVLLFFSLILIGDFYLSFYLLNYLDINILAALLTVSSLLGFVIITLRLRTVLKLLGRDFRKSRFPSRLINGYAGSVLAGVFLVIPGFASAALGLLLFFPLLRNLSGSLLVRRLKPGLDAVYEYGLLE
jgi:UPF0716 family protein affecting phage T7 exclusion